MENEKDGGRYLDALSELEDEKDIYFSKKSDKPKKKAEDGAAQTDPTETGPALTVVKSPLRDRIVTAVLIALIVAAAVWVAVEVPKYTEAKKEQPETTGEPASEESTTSPFFNVAAVNDDLTPELRGGNTPDGLDPAFNALYSANNDFVGWIRVPGTCIDYPVVKGEDNEHYERLNFYGEEDERGSVWLDYRNRIEKDRGLPNNLYVVWGHNFSEHDLAFYEVEFYEDVEYYRTHPVIETQSLYGDTYRWKIIGCILTSVDGRDDNGQAFYYWNTELAAGELMGFTEEVYRRSYFRNPAVDVVPGDKLICISTCTYPFNTKTEYYQTRCVLFGRLVREGESEDVDVSRAYAQPNRRMPQLYYDKNGIVNPYLSTPVFGF